MPAAAGGYFRWGIVAYSLVIQAVSVGMLIYCFALFTLPWLDDFGADRADVMLTITCLQVGMGVLGPWVGRFLDDYPIRYAVLTGVVLLAFGLWLASIATQLWHLWLIYATLMPLSTMMMGTLASQTLVAKWFREQRGLALGISAMGTNLGGVVFPWIAAGWILDAGWRETLWRFAMTALVIVVPLTLIMLRRQPPPLSLGSTSRAQAGSDHRVWSTREILTTYRFWLPFLSLVPLNMGFSAIQFNLGVFVRDIGLNDEAAAPLIMLSSVCMIAGKLFSGSFGDRLDHRFLYWLCMGLMMVSVLCFLFTQSYPGLVVGVIAMGLAGGGILPMMGLIFGALFGAASFGKVMGFVMLNVTLGALAPVLVGAVYDRYESYAPALWGLLALAVPAMLAMVRLPKT